MRSQDPDPYAIEPAESQRPQAASEAADDHTCATLASDQRDRIRSATVMLTKRSNVGAGRRPPEEPTFGERGQNGATRGSIKIPQALCLRLGQR